VRISVVKRSRKSNMILSMGMAHNSVTFIPICLTTINSMTINVARENWKWI
jgi:hypothetical protein